MLLTVHKTVESAAAGPNRKRRIQKELNKLYR